MSLGLIEQVRRPATSNRKLTIRIGRISCRFSPAAGMSFPIHYSDKFHYVDWHGTILTMGAF
jgi:hypothetical protein